jgi:DNA-binding NarL/FixJ family response regulator
MKIRVLLADDHAMMRDGLRAFLTATGYIDVIADVGNGRDAVRLARELRPDVVVMDVGMPEMNGIDATQQLQERCPQVRVAILSMHSSSEHVFRAFRAGASAYVLRRPRRARWRQQCAQCTPDSATCPGLSNPYSPRRVQRARSRH